MSSRTTPSSRLRTSSRHSRLPVLCVMAARALLGFAGLVFATNGPVNGRNSNPTAALVLWLLATLIMMLSVWLLKGEQLPLPPFWQCRTTSATSTTTTAPAKSYSSTSSITLLHAAAAVVVNTTIWVAVADTANNRKSLCTALVCIIVSIEWFTVTLSLLSMAAADATTNKDDDKHPQSRRHHQNEEVAMLVSRCLQACHSGTLMGTFLLVLGFLGWAIAPLVAYCSNLSSSSGTAEVVVIPTVFMWMVGIARVFALVIELAQCYRYLQQVVWSDVIDVNQRRNRVSDSKQD